MTDPPNTAVLSPGVSKRLIAFACAVALVNGMSFTLIFPIMPDLLLSIGAADYTQAARYGGYLVTAFAIAHLLSTPVLGGIADAYGRRPLILLGLASSVIVNLVFAIAGQTWIFILCRVFGGLSAASDLALTSSLADVSEPQDRARLFGYVTASNSLGMIMGPAIGGALGAFDLRAPFVLMAVLKGVLVLYAVVFIRETLHRDDRRAFELRRANPIGVIEGQLSNGLNPAYLVYVTCLVFGIAGLFYVGPYYLGLRFGWGPREIGYTLGLIAIVAIFVQTVFLSLVRR
ncbi:MAG: MFS transporter, partial [Pseudomonadota bacterium]